MLPKEQAAGNAKVEIDRDANAIVLTRVLAVPRALAFEAWTLPEHVRCWWDPARRPLVACEIDLRPGGAFKFVSLHDFVTHEFAGVYREIVPPDYLVFEAMGAIGRVMFEELDGKTHLTVRIECSSASQLDQYLKMGIGAGTARTLDNLAAYVDASEGQESTRPI